MSMLKVEVGEKIVELPEDYDPKTANDVYMCERHRAFFKLMLQKWLDEVKKKLNAENIDDVNADYRSTDESDRIAMEAGTLNELRGKDRLRKLAIKIEENINKIDRDTYGYCEENGSEIGINRLLMRPIARYCLEVQERRDKEESEREFNDRNQDEITINDNNSYDTNDDDDDE